MHMSYDNGNLVFTLKILNDKDGILLYNQQDLLDGYPGTSWTWDTGHCDLYCKSPGCPGTT